MNDKTPHGPRKNRNIDRPRTEESTARGGNAGRNRGKQSRNQGSERPHAPPQPKKQDKQIKKEKQTDWGPVAGWYDQLVADEGSEYQQHVVFPGAIRLLGLKPGQKVLDVGCGQGAFCRLLHEKGASVTGADAAAAMIRLAKQRSDPGIRYLVAPAEKLGEVAHLRGAYGAAVCLLAIQNMDPLSSVMDHMAHCLEPAGRLVIVMMHPAFRGPKHSGWGWDGHGVQYRRVDRYLLPRKHPIYTHPGSDPTRYTWTFHRPLQAYFRALAAAGLVVDALEEWPSHKQSTSGPRAKAENLARREIPMFLAFRAVKLNPADGIHHQPPEPNP